MDGEIARSIKRRKKDPHPPPSTGPHPFFAHDHEEWALPLFMKTGLQPAATSTAARPDIECACCRICNYPGGFEPINSEPPYLDMYSCDVCQQTYHWKCMKELGCNTDGQMQEIDAVNTWAVPPVQAYTMHRN
eukprot:1155471-Pelagomonas_calceolata.AAC.2